MTTIKSRKIKPAVKTLVNDNASLLLHTSGSCRNDVEGTGTGNQFAGEEIEHEKEKDPLRTARMLNIISSVFFVTAFILCNIFYIVALETHKHSFYNEEGWETVYKL